MGLLNVSRFTGSNKRGYMCSGCGNKISYEDDFYSFKGKGIFCSKQCAKQSTLMTNSIRDMENNIFRHESETGNTYRLMGRLKQ